MHFKTQLITLLLCGLLCSTQCEEQVKTENEAISPPHVEENKEILQKDSTAEEQEDGKVKDEENLQDVEMIYHGSANDDTSKTHDEDKGVEPGLRSIPSSPNDKKTAKILDYTNWDSLQSRYAPTLQSQRGGLPYVITEERLRKIRSEFMYWYFDLGGSNENDGDYQKHIQSSSSFVHKNLNFQLPFFGFRYNYTRVSLNGYLEFSDPPPTYPSYPLVFPNKDWPKENDPAFIGIFFSKCRVGIMRPEDLDRRKEGVYFRLERDLQTRTDVLGVEMRERLKWDIRTGVIGAEAFNPKHSVIVTWKNLTFSGGITQSTSKTNTFQLVLATDEVFTYAIFNYLDLQWTTHTEAGGDTTTGEGGVPAFVGFNAGNGTRSFEYKPYSQGTVIRDLTGRGWANGFPGRHIFRIDENILLGTCNKDVDGANLPLVFAPESGNMLGGTVVNITGPCFDPRQKITCTFDTEEVEGIYVERNRAACVQPLVYVEGYIRFEIALGNDKFKWKGKYFVETPATAAEKIFFYDDSVHQKSPAEIKITWVKHNLTTNEGANVRVSLWGYRERTIKPEFVYIDTLGESQNTGEYVITPGVYKNRDNEMLTDLQFGFIQINLTDSIPVGDVNSGVSKAITPVIWSRPVPLGWYFNPQWERLYGKKWSVNLCDNWLRNDRYLKNFAHELPQCPCKLEHALNDKGRFMPDFDCDKDANPKCQHNKGAYHCVKTGSPTLEGSEQQCCYDKNDYLMLSYDQQWGSTPRRSHNLGYLPWNEANKVPTLSQWFHDMVPRYLCCIWQEEQAVGCETLRFERRPTQDCVAYQAPAIAGVFGDPHIVTFDDLEYTFNGKGEFSLIRTYTKSNRLEVQGRFEQLPLNAYGEVRATQLSSIVARGNSSTIIEVRLRPKEARWRYRLDVIANGKRIYFDRPSLKFQHFPGVTVYTPTYILNQSEVIMMFDSGAGVEVIENEGYMSARTYLPWNFINETRGLFGNWSFNKADDFTNPDGSIISPDTNVNDFERIYTDFGMKWLLEDKEDEYKGRSLFYRENGQTSSNFNNKTFKPEFRIKPTDILPANRSIDIEKAYQYCFDNYQCQYDYAVSLNRDLAHFTINYLATIKKVKEQNNQQVVTCGVLETPRFGRKSTFFFIPGTKVTFECNQNFILIGDQRRECLETGRWDAAVYGYTECLREQEYSSRTAALTTAIVLCVIVPLIIGLAYLGYKIIQKRQKSDFDNEAEEKELRRRLEAENAAMAKLDSPLDDDDEDSLAGSGSNGKETNIN